MDRRTFMITGAWLAGAAGGAWPWLARAATQRNTLAIVDSTLACGPSFVCYAANLKLPTFDTGDDIGALWYTTLAPLLGGTSAPRPASLIGVTRASDYFVLSELAMRAGYRVAHYHAQPAGPAGRHAHVAFAFTPGAAAPNAFVPHTAAPDSCTPDAFASNAFTPGATAPVVAVRRWR
ncbi:conserved exported hypothetical protein [Paraburkholderia ribeironis]|uniref:Uncharacterized protein n=1 Tax=Paraburkholderia ribeironis TaxID=1247936 RepID=A0A1N7RXL9_9BURK|nr:conserved exported hypothetical protein [Paraburkholderia ribeironis]